MHYWYESNRFSSSKTYFISKTSPNDQRAQGGKADEDDVNKSLELRVSQTFYISSYR